MNLYKSINLSHVKHPPLKNTSISLIGVCVSYQYFDTLQFMLPVNYLHFEKIYLVTQPDDTRTIEFCSQFQNVDVLFYDFKNNHKQFDKFGALNYAQYTAYQTYPHSWYAIMDSDILLPNNFIDLLKKNSLHPDCIYGIPRHNVFKTSELHKSRVRIDPMPVFKGVPTIIGYFQLYKKKVFHHSFPNASEGDLVFCQYNFKIRRMLENILCYHLGVPGKNWNGKTVSFIDDIRINLSNLYYNCIGPRRTFALIGSK